MVVAPSPEDENVFAEVGVVFYLDDLTDVSEESADEVKYICNHRILGRVRILRVLNPAAWEDQSTYLLAEVEDFKDEPGLEPLPESCGNLAVLKVHKMHVSPFEPGWSFCPQLWLGGFVQLHEASPREAPHYIVRRSGFGRAGARYTRDPKPEARSHETVNSKGRACVRHQYGGQTGGGDVGFESRGAAAGGGWRPALRKPHL